jgi:hypothetical protein
MQDAKSASLEPCLAVELGRSSAHVQLQLSEASTKDLRLVPSADSRHLRSLFHPLQNRRQPFVKTLHGIFR